MIRYASAGRGHPVIAEWRRRQRRRVHAAIGWACLGFMDGLVWGLVLATALHWGG